MRGAPGRGDTSRFFKIYFSVPLDKGIAESACNDEGKLELVVALYLPLNVSVKPRD